MSEDYKLPLKQNRPSFSPPPKLRKNVITSKFVSPVLNRLTPNKTSFPYPSFNPEVGETLIEQCFKIISKIGEGSYGNVFKVQRNSDKCIFAAKVTKAPFLNEQDRNKKLNEVRLHFLFSNHNNVVTLHDAWEERGYLYLLMEFCKETLSNRSNRDHAIPETIVWKMLHDILQALSYIHSKEVIHMDVKMANIMIGQDDDFKLIDFGISNFAGEVNFQNMCGGDQRYLAPEIINQHCTKAADIFSLGVVALEMAGDFILPHEMELLAKLRKGLLPSNHNISPELSRIIQSMLTPDHTIRPSALELLKNETLIKEVRKYHLESCKRKIHGIKDCYSKYIAALACRLLSILNFGLKFFTNVLFSRQRIPVIVEPKTPDCTPEEVGSVSNVISATPPGLTSSGIKDRSSKQLASAISTRRLALTKMTSLKTASSPARNLKHEFSSDDED
nr:PREDICTED: membrane-associated tyrosine- and threonine-specific cdc2-inhibitory kinase [Bemisia tabaci]